MKLFIGLGNPGKKYEHNRHNIGFMVLDSFVENIERQNWKNSKKHLSLIYGFELQAIFAKPQNFMNNSGLAVKKLINYYNIKTSDLWVIHDDLDINLGQYKTHFGRGPKLHNGINSIEESLKTENFWRVRVGIDNRADGKEQRVKGEEYVLQDFSQEEVVLLGPVIERIVEEIKIWINQM